MKHASLITPTIPFDEDGVHRGYLRVPHSTHDSAYGHLPIPILAAKRGEGPTILLTGGIHGDEYEGPLALYEFMRSLDGLAFRGRIIVLPSVNHPAFLAASRVSPIDQINLNRSFPGRRDGSVTEMIADYMSNQILPLADFVLDFHAGGSSLQYLPTLFAPTWTNPVRKARTEGLVRAFAPARVAFFDSMTAAGGEDRVFGNVAERNNCEFLTGEFGGGGTVNLDGRAMAERGIRGVLVTIGLVDGDAGDDKESVNTRYLTMNDPALFAYAPRHGIFEPAYRLGDELAPGALAGLIHDPNSPWSEPTPVHFEGGGLAICIRTHAGVKPGDCLGHLARDIDP